MLIYCNRRWFFLANLFIEPKYKKKLNYSLHMIQHQTVYSIFEGNLYAEINFIFNQIKLLSIMVWLYRLLFIGNLRQKKSRVKSEEKSGLRVSTRSNSRTYTLNPSVDWWHFFIFNNTICTCRETERGLSIFKPQHTPIVICFASLHFTLLYFDFIQSGWSSL